MNKVILIATCSFLLLNSSLNAQCFLDKKGNVIIDASGKPCANTVISAVPFLRITPDARAGAMGDVGIAVSTDANAMHYNTSKLVFAEEKAGVSATYTPWLRALGLYDMYIAYLSGFAKVNERQAIGFSARYFSLGEINFTDDNGTPTGTGSPNELELNGGFAQKLTDKLSVGINAKFIYSNLASGVDVGGQRAKIGYAGAADMSLTYRTPIKKGGRKDNFSLGLALTNIGSKISYTNSANRDYLPANLGIGSAYQFNVNEYNSITVAVDVNKQMVPTPQPKVIRNEDGTTSVNTDWDNSGQTGIPDY
ncbi:MAG: type IX secretion system outer membrane channel protein PorV, partial [Saprospiraceae bacterium]